MHAQLAHQMAFALTDDIMFTGVVAAVLLGGLAWFFGALISIVGSNLSGGMKLVWVAFAFMAPFLGCLLWFLIGRHDAQRRLGIG
ncbi:PLDc N-terminal domain-containing protein [Streptomyces sioyaensis]|uniref:PLDc N-terminal domain-containing protein n=1 Tax=Streptomyces sioyaensis TaxID=67364 RepID=UPI00379C2C5A